MPTKAEIETARAKLALRREQEAATPRMPIDPRDFGSLPCEQCGHAAPRFRHYGHLLCRHCTEHAGA
jgi:hypothetical protein